MNSLDDINHIYNQGIKYIYECNLLYGILNSPKRNKNTDSHYSLILHVCMNTRRGKVKLENFRVLLYGRCTSMILIIRLTKTLEAKEYFVKQCRTRVGNITTNLKVKIDVTLPEFIST